MNTNMILKRFLMAMMLLALLTTAVCSTAIAKWDIDVAKITPEKQSGQITMAVEYLDGTSGTVRLGFNKLGGIWKMASPSVEP